MPATLDLMLAHARHVSQESGKTRQELAAAKTAQQPLHLLLVASRSRTARAIPDIRGLMEAHARRVWQGSTRFKQDQLRAATAVPARILQYQEPQKSPHVSLVRQIRVRRWEAQP